MTAVEASELVDQYTALALSLARQFGERLPWLRDDFISEAGFALWQAATSWKPEQAPFPVWAKRNIRWALLARIRGERAKNPTAFAPQATPTTDGDTLHPIDLATDSGLMPDEAAELADDIGNLPRLLDALPPNRRDLVMRLVVDEEPATDLGAEHGITARAIRDRVVRALETMRAFAECEE